jgi:DNA-binding PadR family transcriptional regulator
MSTTRMLVLGVVRMFQPVHGYDVRRELVSWHVDEWASLQAGSIYNALKSLTKEGMIAVVGTDHVGGRPERTSYELTLRGEQELSDLVRACWWSVRMPIDPLVAAVSLIQFMDRKEAISALEARTAQIRGNLKQAEYAIQSIDGIETPPHVREMFRLINARVGAELGWSKAFAARLAAGEYNTLGDPDWKPARSPARSAPARPRRSKRVAPAKKPRKKSRT